MFKKGATGTPSYRDTLRAHRSHHFLRNGLVFVALALFAGAAALAVVKPPEAPVVYEAQKTLDLPTPFPQAQGDFSAPFISETQIRRGDTLAALLQRLRVQEAGLQAFLVQNKDARSIYKLYPGRSVQAALDQDGNLAWLRYNHTPRATEDGKPVSRWLEVVPDDKGGFTATEQSQQASAQIRIAEGDITSSLFGATEAADIPDPLFDPFFDDDVVDPSSMSIDGIKYHLDVNHADAPWRTRLTAFSIGSSVGVGGLELDDVAVDVCNAVAQYVARFEPDWEITIESYAEDDSGTYDYVGELVTGTARDGC